MDTLKDIVAAGRERNGAAIDAVERATPYSYRELSTNAWKAGNLLGHYGVHPGATVGVAAGPKGDGEGSYVNSADPILTVLGATMRGANATLTPQSPVDLRALVLPWQWYGRYEVTPSCSVLAYGGPPDTPDVTHFETELWSENPMEPPEPVKPDTVALVDEAHSYTHRELLTVSKRLTEEYDIDDSSTVGLGVPLDSAGAFVAGVLAPLSVGATILLGSEGEDLSGHADVIVRSEGTEAGISPATVDTWLSE